MMKKLLELWNKTKEKSKDVYINGNYGFVCDSIDPIIAITISEQKINDAACRFLDTIETIKNRYNYLKEVK